MNVVDGPGQPGGHRGPVTVLCAVIGPVEAAAVGVLAAAPDVVDLTRRCADIAELLAASAAGLGRVAVVSADLAGLDRPVVAALHDEGTRVVALCPDVPWQLERMRAIGVDEVTADADVAAQLLDLVRSLDATGRAEAPRGAGDLGWAEQDSAGVTGYGWGADSTGKIGPGDAAGTRPASDGGQRALGSVVAV